MSDVDASVDATMSPAPEATAADIEGWSCPMPLRDHERIVLGHGGGGQLSGELIEHLFLPAFGAAASTAQATDAAMLDLVVGGSAGGRLAFTTDRDRKSVV